MSSYKTLILTRTCYFSSSKSLSERMAFVEHVLQVRASQTASVDDATWMRMNSKACDSIVGFNADENSENKD